MRIRDRVGLLSGAVVAALAIATAVAAAEPAASKVDVAAVASSSGVKPTVTPDGVVRIGWSRDDVPVRVDGGRLPPPAGLGSWAAFTSTGHHAMVMGDTVVFQDEVDAAMDAAFAHGLSVTGLHNHFFYDEPKVYFMHLGGDGPPAALAGGVKSVWDAIKQVRAAHPSPSTGFAGPHAVPGSLDVASIERTVGQPAPVTNGVAKVTIGREGRMHGTAVGASMGLTTWAAFVGSDASATVDGDVIMTNDEVQPTLKALRRAGFHVVALHNHMMAEAPAFYFTHFWGAGPAGELAKGFRAVLDAQAAVRPSSSKH